MSYYQGTYKPSAGARFLMGVAATMAVQLSTASKPKLEVRMFLWQYIITNRATYEIRGRRTRDKSCKMWKVSRLLDPWLGDGPAT
jgi:hypothetical protein